MTDRTPRNVYTSALSHRILLSELDIDHRPGMVGGLLGTITIDLYL